MFLFGNRFYVIFLTIWIIGLYVVFTTYHHSSTINQTTSDERVKYLQNEIQTLQEKIREMQGQKNDPTGGCEKMNEELKRVKRQLKESTTRTQHAPALEYEQLRRKIETQARELTYFTTDQLNKISKKLSEADQTNWRNVLDRFGDQSRVLLASIRNLTNVDGYQPWREREHASLSKLVQARLASLQNPSSPCNEVKRVTCNINKGCGYGCELHHAMHCFHIAYALGRPMHLFSEGWRYNPGGFEEIFQPLSQNCTQSMFAGLSAWANYETAQIVEIPLIDNIYPRKDFMPMAIPKDISERLIRLHGNPFVWFTGQLMQYLLRPRAWLVEFLQKKHAEIKFETPMVGIHVRRTDKVGTEASFHDISEYMKHVEDYYIVYQYQNPDLKFTKRVFIATDEPTVFQDARAKYPDYVFYGDTAVAQSAQLDKRYGTESLKGVLIDIHFLSLSDYLVCTFSSQICRVAYEVMQQRVVDGAWRVQPLDDVYYFGGQNAHHQRAVISNKAVWSNEFKFQRGDIITTEGNHWDGFSKGSDRTNRESGLYPSYKIEEIVSIVEMYTYPHVQIDEKE